MKADAILSVRFRTSAEGGRITPVEGEFYACPLFVDGEGFDCRLLIGGMKLNLGETYEVPVKFLARELALRKLTIGKPIVLWEGKNVADGRVESIL